MRTEEHIAQLERELVRERAKTARVEAELAAERAENASLRQQMGRPAVDHRLIVEGMLWVVRTDSSWRELPERFGPWSTVSS